MSIIERRLNQSFLKALEKHGNPQWAREELDWKVFVKYGEQFNQLSEEDQWLVRDFLLALKQVHGGK